MLAVLALLVATPALAQDEPAVDTSPRNVAPAPAPAPSGKPGTTIVGERESPIGLYITPWKNSAPQAELDRPARLLDEAWLPLDPDVFARQVEYHRALSEHLKEQGRVAP